jgi:hypothetical protein
VPGRSTQSLGSMEQASRHTTPDGCFTLIFNAADDGVIGFDGYPWHTHQDLLSGLDTEPEIETVEQLIDALSQRRLVLAVLRTNGEITDVWFTDDPESEAAMPEHGETLELRYGDGQPYHAA